MDTKTHVSILQELMVKSGTCLPVYNITKTSGECHNPVFEYSVYANGITATGYGNTKKDAKQDAAKNALLQLAKLDVKQKNDNIPTMKDSNSALSESPRQIEGTNLITTFSARPNAISTPVSMLQEIMVKYGDIIPVYNLTKATGENHNPTFEFVVKTHSVTGTGKGRTKKEAKHNAARNALEKLGVLVPVEQKVDIMEENSIDTPDSSFSNMQSAISILQEYMAKSSDVATYTLIKQSGVSHNPTFEYVVKTKSIIATGQGRTKKEAKVNAAEKALEQLGVDIIREIPNTNSTISISDQQTDIENLINSFNSSGIGSLCEEDTSVLDEEVFSKHEQCKCLPHIQSALPIPDYPNSFKKLDSTLLTNAKHFLENDKEILYFDLENKLINVFKALGIQYWINKLPCNNKNRVGFTIKMETNPFYEIAAFGDSEDQALHSVSLKTINFLKIMLN